MLGEGSKINLVLNPSKTTYMLLSSSKFSSYYERNNTDIDLRVGSTSFERISSASFVVGKFVEIEDIKAKLVTRQRTY